MTSFRMQSGWRLGGLALCLVILMLLGALSATPSTLRAQASPLATPAKAAQTSPLPTAAANAGPVSPLATAEPATPAAAPLAGTALSSPGGLAALVVLGVVVVAGGLVWQRRRPKR